MKSIQETVQEYSLGCERISRRIVELSEEIDLAYNEGGEHKNLVARRYLLYNELAEMQGSLRQMREYLSEQGLQDQGDLLRETVPAEAFYPELRAAIPAGRGVQSH